MMNNTVKVFKRSNTNKNIVNWHYKKIKLASLKTKYFGNNMNFRNLNMSTKFKNRRLLNESDLIKTKLKYTNNISNNFSDTIHSNVKSCFHSSENIMKKAIEFHNNASKDTFYTKNIDATFLTENNHNDNININNSYILHSLNFNSSLNDYLRNKNYLHFFRKSFYNFKEESRIKRRIIYLNNLCKNLRKTYKRNNCYDKFEEKVAKSEIKYKDYKYNIDNYLSFLNSKKIEEDYTLRVLKGNKTKLLEEIKIINQQIDKNQKMKNRLLDMKNFLVKVKGKKDNIDEIRQEINIDMDEEDIDINQNVKTSDSLKRFEDQKRIRENNMNFEEMKIFLSPIKPKRKSEFLNFNFGELSKTPNSNRNKNNNKRYSKDIKSKFINNILYKSINIAYNRPIFSSPDEFMNEYEEKMKNMRNSLNDYYKVLHSINILKCNNISKNNFSILDEYEEKYNKNLLFLKKENFELKNKLKEVKQIKMNKEFNLITQKAKRMVIIVDYYYDLKKQFNIDYDPSFYKKYKNDLTLEEKNRNNLFLLQILEKILDVLIEQNRKYKEDPKYIDRYKKLKAENENVKFEMIRKKQVINLKRKQAEKNKKILENHRKPRFYHFNKNGINLKYFNNSKKYCISSYKENLLDKEYKNRREEMKSLIYYND